MKKRLLLLVGMTSLYEKMILGHWRNRNQAFTDPSKWPQINILYTKIDTDVLELKQWYNYQTEDEPYRHYHITCEYIDDVTVITHPVNQETGKPSCNLQWGYFNGWWFGEVQGECILRNTRVESEIQFNGYFYRSRDTGYDVETGEFRWGKEPEEGLFQFERLNNGRQLDFTLT